MKKPKKFELETSELEPEEQDDTLFGSDEAQQIESALDTHHDDLGVALASAMDAQGIQPVIIFGDAGSGKTAMLCSLIASAKTEPNWGLGISPTDPILPVNTQYGDYLEKKSKTFLGKTLQSYLKAKPAPKTTLGEDPAFFVSVSLQPAEKPEAKFAFLESNGEWYQPDFNSDGVFPPLRPDIESFIRCYQKPLILIYVVPYTQDEIKAGNGTAQHDVERQKLASLAIAGAINNYNQVRLDKSEDQHLLIMTKWDVHKHQNLSVGEILEYHSDRADVVALLEERHSQALTALYGTSSNRKNVSISPYCSGLMTTSNVLLLNPNSELREIVHSFPKRLWDWLYSRHYVARDNGIKRLFDAPKKSAISKLLDWFRGFLSA